MSINDIQNTVLQLVAVHMAQHRFFHFWMQKVRTLITLWEPVQIWLISVEVDHIANAKGIASSVFQNWQDTGVAKSTTCQKSKSHLSGSEGVQCIWKFYMFTVHVTLRGLLTQKNFRVFQLSSKAYKHGLCRAILYSRSQEPGSARSFVCTVTDLHITYIKGFTYFSDQCTLASYWCTHPNPNLVANFLLRSLACAW